MTIELSSDLSGGLPVSLHLVPAPVRMPVRQPLAPEVLHGDRVTLVPLKATDYPEYFSALGGSDLTDEVFKYLLATPPNSLVEAQAIVEDVLADPNRLAFAQRLTETGEFVGTTSIYDIDEKHRCAVLGHTWLAKSMWRTGINSEAKLLLLSYAFESLMLERVQWYADTENLRSRAAIERLGATQEGVLRHHRIRRDGTWRDTAVYGMLASEWPLAKLRLSAPHVS